MKEFDYVIYKESICVLVCLSEDKATIDGIMTNIHNDSYFIYEVDVPVDSISTCDIDVSDKSMISRLRNYRKRNINIFGFVDEELSLIHSFT